MTRTRLAVLILVAAVVLGIVLSHYDLSGIDLRWVLVPGFAVIGTWGLIRGRREEQRQAEENMKNGNWRAAWDR